MAERRAELVGLFQNLSDPAAAARFFDRVSPDVDWTVMGTHPLAGRYRGKNEFTRATFDRLSPLMRDGVRLHLRDLYVDGDVVIAELQARSTALDGAPFDNAYCWVCRFEGDMIVEVRAYLDSAMIAYTVARNER